MTQTELIRDWIDTHSEGITALEALNRFGCLRLAARIRDIKHGVGCSPMDVVTEMETTNGKTYARYKKAAFSALNPVTINRGIASVNLLPVQQGML